MTPRLRIRSWAKKESPSFASKQRLLVFEGFFYSKRGDAQRPEAITTKASPLRVEMSRPNSRISGGPQRIGEKSLIGGKNPTSPSIQMLAGLPGFLFVRVILKRGLGDQLRAVQGNLRMESHLVQFQTACQTLRQMLIKTLAEKKSYEGFWSEEIPNCTSTALPKSRNYELGQELWPFYCTQKLL